tara:strand:+ start:5518 stop:5955 length:438 start_codon:yes stop_codon:yes gene_type:complete
MPYAELLNGIDEIAEKISTAEYQKLMNLLQQSQQEEPEQNIFYKIEYDLINIIPYSYFDDSESELINEMKNIGESDNTVYVKVHDCECCECKSDNTLLVHTLICEGKIHPNNIQRVKNIINDRRIIIIDKGYYNKIVNMKSIELV